jgi:hypothetical protein
MAVDITILGHDFIGGPDCHRPYNTIQGTFNLENPYTPTGEAFGAAELQTAIQTLLGRTDITVSTLVGIQLGDCNDEDTFFVHDGADVLAFNRPAASLNAGTPSVVPSMEWSGALVPGVGHDVVLPAGSFPVAVEIIAGGAGIPGPAPIMHSAAATGEVNYDDATNTLTFFAADAVTECRVLLMDQGAANVSATINGDGTPVEYGAVNLSAIECKFLAVVTQ